KPEKSRNLPPKCARQSLAFSDHPRANPREKQISLHSSFLVTLWPEVGEAQKARLTECIIPGLVAENRKFRRFGIIDYPDPDNSKGSRTDSFVSSRPLEVSHPSEGWLTLVIGPELSEGEVIAACAPVTCLDRNCNSQDHFFRRLVNNFTTKNIDSRQETRCAAGDSITELLKAYFQESFI
ncbi:hypothetical protein TNCV_3999491, partial [Trichonephila clavipes]